MLVFTMLILAVKNTYSVNLQFPLKGRNVSVVAESDYELDIKGDSGIKLL